MEDKLKEFFELNFKEAVVRQDNFRGQFSVYLKKDYLFDICSALKANKEFDFCFLIDVCALDWLGQPDEAEGRFEVIYNLYSLKEKYRLLLKVKIPGHNPEIDSLTDLWHSAGWLEREVFDLFGIEFIGHPDLRKIVTPDELKGHPLRKDLPLTYEMPQFSHNLNDPPEVIT